MDEAVTGRRDTGAARNDKLDAIDADRGISRVKPDTLKFKSQVPEHLWHSTNVSSLCASLF